QAGLRALVANRTTLVIAHRLSTVEGADLIVVMDGGQIVETGNHAELLDRDGYYAALYNIQFSEAASEQPLSVNH
ncbi:MAG: lipid ABC transporter permease/ATP-binding protein, partial [Gammaproteobacteria bacterium]|nr:lipid ABC transporter permease/ATP-binding protein [Gammaproteobacteria bacterium]